MSLEKDLPGPFREGIKALLRVLDPEDNSTGGGAASAVAGAMAAALLAMVGRLSLGNPGMEPRSFYESLVSEAQGLAQVLMLGAQEDAEAFEFVMAAYRMPKADEKDRQKRQEAIQKALEKAAQVPLENARVCARVLELCRLTEDRYNPRASSDFNCARYLAKAALKGCLENVSINLSHLESPELVEELTQASQELETWVVSF
ncbi:MAG: cyclodeaminase/cyclohydrolase family protein [bacterium]